MGVAHVYVGTASQQRGDSGLVALVRRCGERGAAVAAREPGFGAVLQAVRAGGRVRFMRVRCSSQGRGGDAKSTKGK